MPNAIDTNIVDEHDDDDEVDEFTRDDFGFIIGPDGELKSIMYPEHLMEDVPEEIQLILDIFGISSLDSLDDKTIH